MAKETLEQLKLRAGKLVGMVREIEEEERNKVHRPILRKSVGKCFKYSNSYGASDGGRRWPLYAKVISFNEAGLTFEVIRFQRTSRDRIDIEMHREYNYSGNNRMGMEHGWEPITAAEFNRAMKSIRATVLRLMK